MQSFNTVKNLAVLVDDMNIFVCVKLTKITINYVQLIGLNIMTKYENTCRNNEVMVVLTKCQVTNYRPFKTIYICQERWTDFNLLVYWMSRYKM